MTRTNGEIHHSRRPARGDRAAVRARDGAGTGERSVLRVRGRHAEDLRAGRLRAEHHLPRLRRARRDRRRVRHPAARGHRLRGDLAAAAAGDPRRRGRDLRAALRPQHPAHRHHASPRTSSSGARPAGASTLTQQLARKLFLTDEKTWERKIKEAILAIQIEKRYTKNEIFTLYCNQMYFGHGVYGVQAASRLYFGKSAKDLTLEEAALIAGILQGNVRQSPYVNMEAALRRRNYALDADGGSRVHLAGRRRRRAREADRAPRRALDASLAGALLPRGRPQGARSAATAPSSCTKTACRSRPRSTSRSRKPPTAR